MGIGTKLRQLFRRATRGVGPKVASSDPEKGWLLTYEAIDTDEAARVLDRVKALTAQGVDVAAALHDVRVDAVLISPDAASRFVRVRIALDERAAGPQDQGAAETVGHEILQGLRTLHLMPLDKELVLTVATFHHNDGSADTIAQSPRRGN